MKPLFKYIKTPEEIKMQMEYWFLQNGRANKSEFDGTEAFTLFDLLDDERKENILGRISLKPGELPVYLLTVTPSWFIVNTTERFIRIKEDDLSVIDYRLFQGHRGFHQMFGPHTSKPLVKYIKTDGHFADFSLKMKSGAYVVWEMPTGEPGFRFWNVTFYCTLIGEKLLEK